MEMALLNNHSALEAWGRGYADQAHVWDSDEPLHCLGGARELERLAPLMPALSTPIAIVVQSCASRNRSAKWKCQVWGKPFPPGALWRLGQSDVFISAPWFCFLQMAAHLALPDAIRLGMEICGSHSTLPFSPGIEFKGALSPEEKRSGVARTRPMMTAAQLRAELAALGLGESTMAAVAARYVLDNSRSPAESRLYILLCLPPKRGGYGLPKPQLNVSFPLSRELQAACGSPYYIADLYFPQKNLVVEFDGAYHWEGDQRMSDNVRDLVFRLLGITVIRTDKHQLENARLMDLLAGEIAGHLGIRLRDAGPGVLKARRMLREQTLDWASDLYGTTAARNSQRR